MGLMKILGKWLENEVLKRTFSPAKISTGKERTESSELVLRFPVT